MARVTIDFLDQHLLPLPRKQPELSPIEHVRDILGYKLLDLQHYPHTLAEHSHELEVRRNKIPPTGYRPPHQNNTQT